MKIVRSKVSKLLAVALLAGCGGSPTGDGGNGNRIGVGGEDTRSIKTLPALDGDIQEIFIRRGCTTENCHGSSMQGGLGLRSANESLSELVNVSSEADPNFDRVEPNDAGNSYLWLRVSGNSFGPRMPLAGAALDNIDLTNIMNWINRGAPLD